MVTEYFKIAGGTVYDPANGIDGQVRDIWIAGGKIVEPPTDPEIKPARVLDARGLVVMPGGIDMHCHIAGPKVNTARKMCPEQKRRGEPVRRTRITHSGTMGSVPSTFATGYKYAGPGLHHGLRRRHSAPLRPARPRGVRRHPVHRQGLLHPDGQQPLPDAIHPAGRAAEGQGLHRLAPVLREGVCRQARQSRRRRGLEEPSLRQRRRHRLARRPLRSDAATDHQVGGPGGRRAEIAASGAHPRQQPRPARQLGDDARDHEGPGGPSRPHDPHPVSQLRRRDRATRTRSRRRSPRWPSTSTPTPTSRSTSAR